MNIQSFKKVLPIVLKNNIVPFIWGYQGIGKTQTVAQIAHQAYGNSGFVHLHLATQEVGDLVGLLIVQADGTVRHARPEWFPTSGSGIIFLDELNRAHPDVIQAMFSFITSKTIHTHKLPDGWKIVAAGNYQSNEFNVTDTSDAAWMSRFCHLELQPTVSEFTAYADAKGASTVAGFISEHPQMLEQKAKDKQDLFVSPDRRSWMEMIAPLEREEMEEGDRFETYSGIIGPVATSAFFAHKNTGSKAIRLKDILKDYSKVKLRVKEVNKKEDTRFDILATPIDELVTLLGNKPNLLASEKDVNSIKEFFLDIPLELLAKACKKISTIQFENKDKLLNDPVFVAKLTDRT